MAEFTYSNAKNASTGYMPFELNYGYQLWMSYEEKIDPNSQSKSADKLSEETQRADGHMSQKPLLFLRTSKTSPR